MTALAKDTKLTTQLDTPDTVFPRLTSLGVLANTTIYAGSMVAKTTAGYAVPASADNTLKIIGRAEEHAVGTSVSGATKINVRRGAFSFVSSGLTIADIGAVCYAVDDVTISTSSSGGARPLAGVITDIVDSTHTGVLLGVPSLYMTDQSVLALGLSTRFRARGVAIANQANLAAFVVANNGVTYVAGDVVLLTAQTTAAENGPYLVGTVAGTAPLTRPDWWPAAGPITPGAVIEVSSECTLHKGSTWKAMCVKAKVIDTHDPLFYPQNQKFQCTLTAGTITLGATQGLMLYSVTEPAASTITINRSTANTTTNTVNGYTSAHSGRTAGVSGTAAATIIACVADGSINVADVSTLDVLVTNW